MNNYKNISRKTFAKIGAVGLLCVLLSSCLKETHNQPAPPAAFVTFIQASPDQPALDFYLNDNRVNLNPMNYGDNVDYFRAYAGKRTANFYNHSTAAKVFSDTVTFLEDNIYSMFLANKASSPEIVLLKDTINRPATGKASIRFVNLSPDAPAVDLAVQDGDVLVPNKAYKGFSTFLPIAGNKTYNLQVLQHGTNTVLATLSNVPLNTSFVYTLWFHGLSAGTGADKLALNVITNAYF